MLFLTNCICSTGLGRFQILVNDDNDGHLKFVLSPLVLFAFIVLPDRSAGVGSNADVPADDIVKGLLTTGAARRKRGYLDNTP